jgi:hypothetical protein
MSVTTVVRNLRTGEERHYSLLPRDAVIAAFAQGTEHDFNTWTYERAYGHRVQHGDRTVACGDWAALTTPPPREARR